MENVKIDPEAWYSEAEVAQLYGIGVKALNRRLNSGRLSLRYYAPSLGGRRLFQGADILDDLHANKAGKPVARQPGVR